MTQMAFVAHFPFSKQSYTRSSFRSARARFEVRNLIRVEVHRSELK